MKGKKIKKIDPKKKMKIAKHFKKTLSNNALKNKIVPFQVNKTTFFTIKKEESNCELQFFKHERMIK